MWIDGYPKAALEFCRILVLCCLWDRKWTSRKNQPLVFEGPQTVLQTVSDCCRLCQRLFSPFSDLIFVTDAVAWRLERRSCGTMHQITTNLETHLETHCKESYPPKEGVLANPKRGSLKLWFKIYFKSST